jgi:acyl-CoA thioester hydrolase
MITFENNFFKVNKMDVENIKFRHEMPVQLRFSDVDQFGHVNNSVYFSLFDMCKTKYILDALGQDSFHNIGVVVAHINADFIAPIFYQDEVVIQTAVQHIGNKSFTLYQRVINPKTQELKCVCQTVMVTYDLKNNKSIEIEHAFKVRLAEFDQNPDFLKTD